MAERIFTRDEGDGYTTVVEVLRLKGGGGDVRAYVAGPRGGRTAILTAFDAGDARRQIRRKREVLNAIEQAIPMIEQAAPDG